MRRARADAAIRPTLAGHPPFPLQRGSRQRGRTIPRFSSVLVLKGRRDQSRYVAQAVKRRAHLPIVKCDELGASHDHDRHAETPLYTP